METTRKRPQTNNQNKSNHDDAGRGERRRGGGGRGEEGGNRRTTPGREQARSATGSSAERGQHQARSGGRGAHGPSKDVASPTPSAAARPTPPPSGVVRAALPSKPAPWAVRATPAAPSVAPAPTAATPELPAPAAAAASSPSTPTVTTPPSEVTVVAVPLPVPSGAVTNASADPTPALPVAVAPPPANKEARLDEVAGLCLGSFDATELPTARSPIVPSPSSPLPEKDTPPSAALSSPPPRSPAAHAPHLAAAAAAAAAATAVDASEQSPSVPADGSAETAAATASEGDNGVPASAPEPRKPVANAWGKGAPAILQRHMEAQKKAAVLQQQQQPASTKSSALRHFDEVRLVWDASFARAALRGLHNEGNTCFLNATVQCLLACPPFIGFLRSLRGRRFPCPAPTLNELVRFAEAFEMEKKANTPMVPLAAKAHFGAVIKKLAGTPGRQEDAHEFLSLLLDTVHEELRAGSPKARTGGESGAHHKAGNNEANEWNEVGRKNKTSKLRTAEFEETAVTRIFGCKLRSCLKSRGAKQSITQELFNALPLDVSVPQIRSLDDALLGFMSAESLDWEVRASKEYKFERMPGVLVVHLKRFAFSAAGGDKIAKHIEFPERLVIPTTLLGPHAGGGEKERRSYDLFGVVEHHGHTLQSGHYTASIKRDQNWYHVDDTAINPTAIQTVLRRQAYLLFYLRSTSSSSSSSH